jgi:hypothetical protein
MEGWQQGPSSTQRKWPTWLQQQVEKWEIFDENWSINVNHQPPIFEENQKKMVNFSFEFI